MHVLAPQPTRAQNNKNFVDCDGTIIDCNSTVAVHDATICGSLEQEFNNRWLSLIIIIIIIIIIIPIRVCLQL